MRGHDHVRSGIDGRLERHQFSRIQLFLRGIDGRQPGVGIRGHIAMAREVLGARCDVLLLHACDVCGGKLSGDLRITAEGTQSDDRVVRIIIHIGVRREVGIHADRAQLAADDLSGHDGIVRIPARSKRHIARQRRSAGQPVHDAALLVSADHQRDGVFA